jgi:uncharacterized membrane protein YkvA (DUF1232 family)
MLMVRGIFDQFVLTWKLLRDPRVPMMVKAVPVLALLYIMSPLDVIPDFLPGLGQLDDIGILIAAMRLFESLSPEMVVASYRRELTREHSK